MNHSINEVEFKVRASLQFGQEVRLSGNVPVLGCDDPSRAIPLVTSSTDFPWWETKEALFLPGDSDLIHYRYCIFSGGKFVRWEGDFVRSLSFDRAKTSSVVDIFGEYPVKSAIDPATISKSLGQTEVKSFLSSQLSEWSRKELNDVKLSENDGVVIVSYFLPVILGRVHDRWTVQWDNENVLALTLPMRVSWVGFVTYGGQPIPSEEEEAVTRLLQQLNCHPIFINRAVHHQFYEVFCKQYLWPIMHQVSDVYGPLNQMDIGTKGQQDLWFTYSTVNRTFRDKIVEVYQQGDLVWVHGFHLMLLPSFLRRVMPRAKIGMFLHTPFPSSEIWRTLSRREDLIRGILSADHIGFHLYEYARHFRTVCMRLLGYSSDMNASGSLTINVDGREVAITCMHIGVNVVHAQKILSSPQFEKTARDWKNLFQNRTVVAGIDRLERLKGIPLKLSAIDRFMEAYPSWRGKLLFVMIGISATERGDDYRQTQHDVGLMVEALNEKYGNGPEAPLVHFEEHNEREVRLLQRLAFFAASDILMSTAARDGLNRLPVEFALAKQQSAVLGIGSPECPMVISKFISCARVMRGAITVNPWNVEKVKESLKKVLLMEEDEKRERTKRNLEFANRMTTTNWAMHVLHDLKSVDKNVEPTESFAVGFGMGFRVMGVKSGFQPLNLADVGKSYRNSHCRLIVLDWGGTIVAENDKIDALQAYSVAKGHASRAGPTPELKSTLEKLCADPRNVVFVVSGKEVLPVSEFFGDIEGLGLGAEHGFYYRWPSWERGGKKWQTVYALGSQSWKKSVLHIMNIYVQRTHGTYIEQKGCALIWQFRDADPEFGFRQSQELEQHLKMTTTIQNLEVIRGGGVSDGYIEVRPAGISKGLFLQHALSTLKSMNRNVDFILAVGDDISDEPMFERVRQLQDSAMSSKDVSSFAVTVGKKPTHANSYVDDPAAVLELLTMLVRTSKNERRFFSSVDLPSYAASNLSGFAQNVKDQQVQFQQQQQQQQQQHQSPRTAPQAHLGLTRGAQINPFLSGVKAMSEGNLAQLAETQQHKRSNAELDTLVQHTSPSTKQPESDTNNRSFSQYLGSFDECDETDEGLFLF